MNSADQYEYIGREKWRFPVRVFSVTDMKRISPHWHEAVELLLCTDGEAEFSVGGQTVPVQKGDLLIVNFCDVHYRVSGEVTLICVQFSPQFTENMGMESIRFFHKISRPEEFCPYFETMLRENTEAKPGYEAAVMRDAYALLCDLLRSPYAVKLSPDEREKKRKTAEKRKAILAYIDEHYNERLTTASIAERFYLSEPYFCRFFKTQMGVPLITYLNRYRADMAAKMLRETELGIAEIAAKTGYPDENYFCRVFRGSFGQSPLQYRKAQQKNG